MLNRRQLLTAAAASAVVVGTSGTVAQASAPTCQGRGRGPTFRDLGATPAVIDVARLTRQNRNFRTAAWTNDDLQLTFMSIPVGGDVGLEMHSDVDQFLRVEEGRARVYFGTSESSVKFYGMAKAGDAILVPSGTWHNIVNASRHDCAEAVLAVRPAAAPRQHRATHQAGRRLRAGA